MVFSATATCAPLIVGCGKTNLRVTSAASPKSQSRAPAPNIAAALAQVIAFAQAGFPIAAISA
jgi:hypothetical protein